MKNGDTYCTLWTTGLSGPFEYNMVRVLSPNIIVGERGSLLLAQEGFDVMYNHTLDGDYDFVHRMIDFLSDDSIDECIDIMPDSVLVLTELKKYSKRIKETLGATK